jgi:hypothetical protein
LVFGVLLLALGIFLCVVGAAILSSQKASAEGGGLFALFALALGWFLVWRGWRLVSRRPGFFASNLALSVGLVRARASSFRDALPTRPSWAFEPKWGGFRAIVRAAATGREVNRSRCQGIA